MMSLSPLFHLSSPMIHRMFWKDAGVFCLILGDYLLWGKSAATYEENLATLRDIG